MTVHEKGYPNSGVAFIDLLYSAGSVLGGNAASKSITLALRLSIAWRDIWK